ncbi:MAG: hypothetical protein CM1200mP24_08880 [Gammaproteobacteria bacterium]|nr:MAG: hypothetical protein CM1200mP24_08880 [Gammaproteobacteria bacterium]
MPRNILVSFEVRKNGDLGFETRLFPGIAANPFLSFYLKFDTRVNSISMARPTRNEHLEKRQVQNIDFSCLIIALSFLVTSHRMESISGFEFQSPGKFNPYKAIPFWESSSLWVDQGFTLFTEEPNSCKSCHESNLSKRQPTIQNIPTNKKSTQS